MESIGLEQKQMTLTLHHLSKLTPHLSSGWEDSQFKVNLTKSYPSLLYHNKTHVYEGSHDDMALGGYAFIGAHIRIGHCERWKRVKVYIYGCMR